MPKKNDVINNVWKKNDVIDNVWKNVNYHLKVEYKLFL